MKKTLIRYSTLDMPTGSEKWLQFRRNGVGGSEVGVVLGLSPYKSSVELFYEKLFPIKDTAENEAMHWGNALEELIADRWQYWDGDAAGMIKNFAEGKVHRKCSRMNCYIVNPDYPWLFSSLDRVIHKHNNDTRGILEIKTISGFVTRQWEHEIPPSHVVQLQDYLLVTELPYGELALLKDGRYMSVVPFVRNETICNKIVTKTKEFWDRVLAGRQILESLPQQAFSIDEVQDPAALGELHKLEPPADSSEAYEQFLNTRYKGKPITMPGAQEHLEAAERYSEYGKEVKVWEEKQRTESNYLKTVMGEAEVIDLGSRGKVVWRNDKKGIRRFNVNLRTVVQKEESQTINS